MVYIALPSPALLKNCPQFESLHKKLTFSLLDIHGAVKSEIAPALHVETVSNETADGQIGSLKYLAIFDDQEIALERFYSSVAHVGKFT